MLSADNESPKGLCSTAALDVPHALSSWHKIRSASNPIVMPCLLSVSMHAMHCYFMAAHCATHSHPSAQQNLVRQHPRRHANSGHCIYIHTAYRGRHTYVPIPKKALSVCRQDILPCPPSVPAICAEFETSQIMRAGC